MHVITNMQRTINSPHKFFFLSSQLFVMLDRDIFFLFRSYKISAAKSKERVYGLEIKN